MKKLSKYFLADTDNIRVIVWAVKNILDYDSDTQLWMLCKALDVYQENVLKKRKVIISEKS